MAQRDPAEEPAEPLTITIDPGGEYEGKNYGLAFWGKMIGSIFLIPLLCLVVLRVYMAWIELPMETRTLPPGTINLTSAEAVRESVQPWLDEMELDDPEMVLLDVDPLGGGHYEVRFGHARSLSPGWYLKVGVLSDGRIEMISGRYK